MAITAPLNPEGGSGAWVEIWGLCVDVRTVVLNIGVVLEILTEGVVSLDDTAVVGFVETGVEAIERNEYISRLDLI